MVKANITKLKGGRYQVRWRDAEGKQRSRNFAKGYIEEARDFVRELQQEAHVEPQASQLAFENYAKAWLERHAKVEKSPTTVAVEGIWIRVHLVPAFGAVQLGRLTEGHALTLRAKLAATHAPKTVNSVLALARQIVATAKLKANPFDGVKRLPVPDCDFDFWTAEERDRFLAVAKERDPELYRLVLVAVHTGLRKGELAALTRGQLDFSRGIIRVDATFCPRLKLRIERSKNRTVGRVPMALQVHAALLELKDEPADRLVFDPATFRLIARRFPGRAKAWGFRPIRFHDLRHSFASILVMAGVPLYTVQKLMRHKSIAMTERYAHLAPDYLADAIEAGSASKVHSGGTEANSSSEIRRKAMGVVGLEPTARMWKKSV